MRTAEHSDRNHLAVFAVAVLSLAATAALPISAQAAIFCAEPPVLTEPRVYEGKCPEEAGGPAAVVHSGDVLIKLPTNKVCEGSINIARARNVWITGGSIAFDISKAAVTNYFDGRKAVITVKESSGTTFIEGLDVDAKGTSADAIRALMHTGRLVIQNTRIHGVSGRTTGPHGDTTHAQAGGPLFALVLQNVSAFTGYQGLFTPYRVANGHGTRKLKLQRVNFGYDPNIPLSSKPLKLMFIGSASETVNRSPDRGTSLSHVYVDVSVWQQRLPGFSYQKAIFPVPSPQPDGCAIFDPADKIWGQACGGNPPDGDFAPAERVGLAYDRAYFCRN